MQPPGKIRRPFQSVRLFQQQTEHTLGDVLRCMGIPNLAQGGRVDQVDVSGDEICKGVLGLLFQIPGQEFGVIHRDPFNGRSIENRTFQFIGS
jgi:hypothetical protein